MIKNILRNIFKKKIQTLVLFLLVLVAGLIFTYFDIPLTSIKNAFTQLQTESKMEQFRFMVSGSYDDLEKLIAASNTLGEKYGFVSEPVRKKFVQQEYNNKKCNFYIRPLQKNINTAIFITGSRPYVQGQIAVSKLFAEGNGLMTGSRIKIDGNDYVVTGIYISPDEIAIFDATKSVDISADVNAGILMTADDFQAVNKYESIYFVGRFAVEDEDYLHSQVSNLSKEDNVLFAALSTEYQEISILTTLIDSNTSFMLFALVLIYIILSVAIFIQISNQFTTYRKPIGVLISMGVSRQKVAYSHGVYFFLFSIATALGMVIGFFMADTVVEFFSNSYNAILVRPPIDWPRILVFGAVVTAVLTLFVVLFANGEAKKKPLTLIYTSNDKQAVGLFIRTVKKVISALRFENRIMISIAAHKRGRLFLMLLAFFIAFNLLGTGIAIENSTGNAFEEYKQYIKFDRMDIYDVVTNNATERYRGADIFIDTNVKLIKNTATSTNINNTFILEGISQNQVSLGINGKKLMEGLILPRAAALKYGINVGDELQFLINGGYFRYKVAEINESAFDNKIYININELYKMDQYKTGDYNGAYVSNDSREQDVLYSIRSEDLIDFSAFLNQTTESVSGMLLALSVIISLALIILVAAFNYNDVMAHVALFKFFGYSNRKSNNMLINVFDPVGLLGCVLGMFSIPYLSKLFETAMLASSDYYVPFKATWIDRIVALLALMILYAVCKFIINLFIKRWTAASILKMEA